MDNSFAVEMQQARGSHCGFGVAGPGAGICKDKQCRKHAPALFAGYCADCAPSHGINLLRIVPEATPVTSAPSVEAASNS